MKLKDFLKCISDSQDVRVVYVVNGDLKEECHIAGYVRVCCENLGETEVITSYITDINKPVLTILVNLKNLDD